MLWYQAYLASCLAALAWGAQHALCLCLPVGLLPHFFYACAPCVHLDCRSSTLCFGYETLHGDPLGLWGYMVENVDKYWVHMEVPAQEVDAGCSSSMLQARA